MTTGLIFAVLSYLTVLILTTVGWFAFTGGDGIRTFDAMAVVAKFIGPAFVAPLGFIVGFFRESRINRQKRIQAEADARKARHQREANKPRTKSDLEQTTTVRTLAKPSPGREIPDEVRAYLKKSSHVDTEGIKTFLKETRSHHLEEMRAQMERDQA